MILDHNIGAFPERGEEIRQCSWFETDEHGNKRPCERRAIENSPACAMHCEAAKQHRKNTRRAWRVKQQRMERSSG